MNWPEAFLEAIKWICGAAVVIFLLLPLMDFSISFYPPKDRSDAMPAETKATEQKRSAAKP